ncbi:MAG: uroporphyrinogen-III C-methyltransferase [Bacteroidales bacterium]|nr:uroporphyrinogen-III C-methyltransferase [Bacteroidales bacterium]
MPTSTPHNPIRVISRRSPLALLQVKEFFSLFPQLPYTVQEVASYGDRHKDVSLMADIASDFFTRELDRAVLSGEADVAVHSAKDLPYPLPAGLELYCLTRGGDKSDSLVSRDGLTLAQLPAGSRVGTSSKMRRAELLQLRQDIEVVSIRGTIEERIAQVDSGHIDALIVATCALQRLGLDHRIAERLPFKTHPLQGNLAVVGKTGRPALKALFAAHDHRRTFGSVTLVGFGPGRPDLLTLAGDAALAAADVIFHDDLLDRDFLSRYAARKVYVGKRAGRHSHRQDEINEMVYAAAVAGEKVVRLKGGDPMIFAHGREEIDCLRSRFVEVTVIPGISSGIALAAATGIPLTHRGIASSVAFVSGHGSHLQTPTADTLVYYMGGANLPEIAAALLSAGRPADTPVALVCNVSLPDQRTFFTTLGEMRYAVVKYPTPLLAIVGEVVAFEAKNHSARVLATGTVAPAPAPGETIVHTPLIRIERAEVTVAEKENLRRAAYDWLIFTSRYGVQHFFALLDEAGIDLRRLSHVQIASVGPVTSAALADHHLHPDVESPTQSAEGLLQFFGRQERRQRILLPRSDKGLPALSDGLRAQGHCVTHLTVYANRPAPDAPRVDLAQFEKILFASPSGVGAFCQKYTTLPVATLLVGKGDTTKNKLKETLNEKV